MSLRARLLAGLLVLAAAGLITLAAITYAEQRSFLYQRVDSQLTAAQFPVSSKLDQSGANVPGYERPQPPAHSGGAAPRDGNGGPGGPRPGDFPGYAVGLRRDANGKQVGKPVVVTTSTSTERLAMPKFPAKLAVGHTVTVGSVGSSLQYRVRAYPTRDQPGTTLVAVPLREVSQTLNRLLLVLGLVIGGVLLALGALAWWVVRLGLRPLDRMGATAGAIAAGDLSRRVSPANPRTEVGRLGLALNGMLAQIEKAFAEREASESRLRRFLADASHELRTPLSSIRGYAELFRMGAAKDADDTEKAMRRIEDEARRMGVLVEDLLTLARMDELRDPVREPVELRRLARDAVDDTRAVAPERSIELAENGPAVVLGDRDELRKVIANLMRNAIVHTPAGTPIEVSVKSSNGDAVIEVRDHGLGLPPDADPAELFERFWRSEPGRRQGPGGAGLGLAIVSAIVAAHGGSVSAQNAEGGGASFVVRLPEQR
jgi:two-component system OmpR family sensor kinase